MTQAERRHTITATQALAVFALGYSLVVALAAMSDVAITSHFAMQLGLSQVIGMVGYSLFRGWCDTPAARRYS
jgi:hypothetical protein